MNQGLIQYFKEKFGRGYSIYDDSIKLRNDDLFFIARDNKRKYLIIISRINKYDDIDLLKFENIKSGNESYNVYFAHLSFNNLNILNKIFTYLKPTICNARSSFGTGDRLGIVTPAHVMSLKNKKVFPVLAQQSVRELNKTGRTWSDVLNDVCWGIFETDYNKPFGADADHIKRIEDLEVGIKADYSMLTLDPSDYVRKEITEKNKEEIEQVFEKYNSISNLEQFYIGKKYRFGDYTYEFNIDFLKELVFKYMNAISFIKDCFDLLKEKKKNGFDLEVSMDEISEPVSPLAHLFIVEELIKNGVDFKNLALRFIGKWEKAIDYIGDKDSFKEELKIHYEIVKNFKFYKLSLHSGSDKFSAYPAFSEVTEGNFHVKTAGVSWLEALRVIAKEEPSFFRELFIFSLKNYEIEKASYEVSAQLRNMPDISKMEDTYLPELLNRPDIRQVLHINYGIILSSKNFDNSYLFKDRLYDILFQNEDEHYNFVSGQINKHLELLKIN